MPSTTFKRLPVALCLFLSASIAAICLASLSNCVFTFLSGCRLSNWQRCLSAHVCMFCWCLWGALLSQTECWMALNPRDIRWRDSLRCYYPCGGVSSFSSSREVLGTMAWESCKRQSNGSFWSTRKIVMITQKHKNLQKGWIRRHFPRVRMCVCVFVKSY